jgi:hypothetical protein
LLLVSFPSSSTTSQVQPGRLHVVLAEVIEEHGALGALGHGEPGGQLPAAEAAAVTVLGVAREHRRSSRRTPRTHAYPGGCAVLVAVAFLLHDFKGLSYDGAGFG